MNSFQWMIGRYTSANVELSPDELKQVQSRCDEIVSARRFRFWFIVLSTAATTGLAAMICGRMLGPPVAAFIGLPEKWGRAGFAVLAAALAMTLWLGIYTHMYVRPLRRALGELGYPVCVRCGYWLRGLGPETSRCPECGTEAPDHSVENRSVPVNGIEDRTDAPSIGRDDTDSPEQRPKSRRF